MDDGDKPAMTPSGRKRTFTKPLFGSLNESLRIHCRNDLNNLGFGDSPAIRGGGRANAAARSLAILLASQHLGRKSFLTHVFTLVVSLDVSGTTVEFCNVLLQLARAKPYVLCDDRVKSEGLELRDHRRDGSLSKYPSVFPICVHGHDITVHFRRSTVWHRGAL